MAQVEQVVFDRSFEANYSGVDRRSEVFGGLCDVCSGD